MNEDIYAIVDSMSWPKLPPEVQYGDDEILIQCAKCKLKKPLDEFGSDKRRRTRNRFHKAYSCKACLRKVENKNNETPGGVMSNRNTQLRIHYGIDHKEYERILAIQKGKCAVCPATSPGGRGKYFHVDHDHATKKIRGLLCHHCNTGIGKLGDSVDGLHRAIAYLEKNSMQLDFDFEPASSG